MRAAVKGLGSRCWARCEYLVQVSLGVTEPHLTGDDTRALWSHWRVPVASSGLQPGRVLGLRDSTLQKWLSPSGAPAAVLEPIPELCKEKMPSPDPCRSHEPLWVFGIWIPQGLHCQHHPDFLLGAVEKRGLLPGTESLLCWLCPAAVGAAQAGCSVAWPLLLLLNSPYFLILHLLLLIPGTMCRGAGGEAVLDVAGAHGRIFLVSGRPLGFYPKSENRIYSNNLSERQQMGNKVV